MREYVFPKRFITENSGEYSTLLVKQPLQIDLA